VAESSKLLELYGREVGAHRPLVDRMALPLNAPVVCEAKVEIDS
jgi:hypothetical protein